MLIKLSPSLTAGNGFSVKVFFRFVGGTFSEDNFEEDGLSSQEFQLLFDSGLTIEEVFADLLSKS